MDSRMCSAQKCAFWQGGADRRHARALSVSFERPLSPSWTSPQLTTSAFLESPSLCHVLCECHNKAGVGTNVDIRSSILSRTRSSFEFSAFAFTVTHIVKVTGKGATTTLPSPSPSHPCSRRRDRRSKLRKARRTTANTQIKNP